MTTSYIGLVDAQAQSPAARSAERSCRMDGKYRRGSSCWTRIASFSSVLLLFVPSLMAVDLTIVTLGTSFYRTVDPGSPLTIQYRVEHRTAEPLTATVTVALPAGARFERALWA